MSAVAVPLSAGKTQVELICLFIVRFNIWRSASSNHCFHTSNSYIHLFLYISRPSTQKPLWSPVKLSFFKNVFLWSYAQNKKSSNLRGAGVLLPYTVHVWYLVLHTYQFTLCPSPCTYIQHQIVNALSWRQRLQFDDGDEAAKYIPWYCKVALTSSTAKNSNMTVHWCNVPRYSDPTRCTGDNPWFKQSPWHAD